MRVRVQVTTTTFYSPTVHSSGNIGVDARELVETANLRFMPRRSIISSADRRLAAARAGSDPLGRKVDHRRLQAHREPFEMTLPELLHERRQKSNDPMHDVGCCLKKQAEP